MLKLLEELYEAVLEGEDDLSEELTRSYIAVGIEPQTLIDNAMIPAMAEAGRRFEVDEYFVPELLLAGRAIKAAGLRDKVRVLVGGAPLSEDRAAEFGAEAYAGNVNSAVRAVLQLVASV